MGRPLKDIDENQVLELAKIQCTYDEIAAVMACSVDTLSRRFADVIKQGREEGLKSLRRAQYDKAIAGNPALLIWLGKQYLGQSDRMDVTAKFNPAEDAAKAAIEEAAQRRKLELESGDAPKVIDVESEAVN